MRVLSTSTIPTRTKSTKERTGGILFSFPKKTKNKYGTLARNYSPPALKHPLFCSEISLRVDQSQESSYINMCYSYFLLKKMKARSRKKTTTTGVIKATDKNYDETDLESGCWTVELIRLPTLALGEKLKRITSRAVRAALGTDEGEFNNSNNEQIEVSGEIC